MLLVSLFASALIGVHVGYILENAQVTIKHVIKISRLNYPCQLTTADEEMAYFAHA